MTLRTTLSLLLCALASPLQAASIEKQAIEFIGPFAEGAKLKAHETPFRNTIIDTLAPQLVKSKQSLQLGTQTLNWQRLDKVSGLTLAGMQALRYEFSTERFTQGTLKLQGLQKATVYLNGERVGDTNELSLALVRGDHQLLIIAEQVDDWQKVDLDFTGKNQHDVLITRSGDTQQALSAKQLFDAPTISALSIAPNGQLHAYTQRHYQDSQGNTPLFETLLLDSKGNIHYRFEHSKANQLVWRADSKKVLLDEAGQLKQLDLASKQLSVIAPSIEGASDWRYLDDNTLLFSWSKNTDDKDKLTKHYRGLEDRWSYFRNNSQLYTLDLRSGLIEAVSSNKLSYSLADIDTARGKILVTRSPADYQAPPHMLTELVEIDLSTKQETLLGQYRTFNQALYTKDGFYVVAGPDFMNGLGRDLPNDMLANNYDGQLYWLSRDGKQAKALSKTFDPAIGDIALSGDDDLVLKVTERDTQPLYFYDSSKASFQKLNTGFDVVDGFAISQGKKSQVLVSGSTASTPQQLKSLEVGKNKASILWDSAPLAYQDAEIAKLEEFNFTNKAGVEIKGRVYLPADLDTTKQYPALVYYYGGTSPVNRGFSGRYPFNHWAAQGYVVYVLQPTGATGFGQQFSAQHVNAWGEHTAEDIIQGTQAFLNHYSFVNKRKVGNLGASYGGFMTMLLATKTDLFSASIAHAGISNITSYWGQGWWGYLYSGEASKNSFPWNNPTLYSQHSPVFHADKVNSPLLLIHGDADTNVPPGESQTMYTALKVLGKDVELVEFKGADHQIFARDRRFKWWNTMLAYFDMHLKDEPQWWQYIYSQQ
ncbi:alpha/beta hydrolase family protein [Pseudoalteromonas fenneropenaei]|uniref:Alpha/beta hydrolase family protein n=1 Tax=Pseudoalteromonas fenneropenaei TaxID=1737459 RepID=A0ABV7CK42_9GAMM